MIATHDIAIASRCDRVVRIVDGALRDDIDVAAASDLQATLGRLARSSPR